jgi:hypothetical protein
MSVDLMESHLLESNSSHELEELLLLAQTADLEHQSPLKRSM